MARRYDLLVDGAYLPDRDGIFDIGVSDGRIDAIEPELDARAETTIDADGHLVTSGFVDCHKHLDRGLAAIGERRPRGNDEPMTHRSYHELFDDYYREIPRTELVERIVENVEMAVAAGTTHVRSHVTVDHSIGTGTMDAALEAVERTDDLVDVELVVAADGGLADNEGAVRTAIEMAPDDVAVLVGGSDGNLGVRDRGDELERWFELAAAYDIGVDVHVTARESLGVATLEELASLTDAYDLGGDVTAVHAYALAMIPEWRLADIAETLRTSGVNVVTCFNSTRSSMPIRELLDAGVSIAHGTDNDRDFVVPHGNADPLEAAQILSLKLNYGPEIRRPTREYRWYDTNRALRALWRLVTEQGASALDVDGYGIATGTPADLVVIDAPSPEWAIVDRAERTHVIKGGRLVAREGTVRPSS